MSFGIRKNTTVLQRSHHEHKNQGVMPDAKIIKHKEKYQ